MIHVTPVTLEGKLVRLEHTVEQYAPALLAASQSPEIWQYLPFGPYKTLEDFTAWLKRISAYSDQSDSLSFTIFDRSSDQPVGMTSFLNIARRDDGLEIGGTWLDPRVWRTAINTECKYLLLRHAFEALGCMRVQLKTDARNVRSQRAIERLGAVKEGVLRQHMLLPDGYRRDTVMYSIIDSEWPNVKARLEGFLSR